jgi:hypothetical protein
LENGQQRTEWQIGIHGRSRLYLRPQEDPLSHQSAKSVITTRKAQLDAYNAALADVDGLDLAFLKDFGLESKLVSGDTRRQDFHAKLFIGLINDRCAVLSGSANLTRGPSVENISFRSLSAKACQDKYIQRIGVTLPPRVRAASQFVLIRQSDQGWSAAAISDPRLAS